jgi:predicted Fe-S protein YdhL (DUF1289 family)
LSAPLPSDRTGVLSPCVRRCTLDPARGICVGCGRTLAEIGNWMRYSDEERRAIMATLPARLKLPPPSP